MCQDNTHTVIGTCIGLMILSTAAVLLRLASRRVSALSFWWDDAVIISSLVRDAMQIPNGTIVANKNGRWSLLRVPRLCSLVQSPQMPRRNQTCSRVNADAKNGVGRHFETVPESSVVLLFKVSRPIPSVPDPREHR